MSVQSNSWRASLIKLFIIWTKRHPSPPHPQKSPTRLLNLRPPAWPPRRLQRQGASSKTFFSWTTRLCLIHLSCLYWSSNKRAKWKAKPGCIRTPKSLSSVTYFTHLENIYLCVRVCVSLLLRGTVFCRKRKIEKEETEFETRTKQFEVSVASPDCSVILVGFKLNPVGFKCLECLFSSQSKESPVCYLEIL